MLEELRRQPDWTTEPIRILHVCGPCQVLMDKANQRHVQLQVANEVGLEQAQHDLQRQFDQPSNYDYLVACQRMREGDW